MTAQAMAQALLTLAAMTMQVASQLPPLRAPATPLCEHVHHISSLEQFDPTITLLHTLEYADFLTSIADILRAASAHGHADKLLLCSKSLQATVCHCVCCMLRCVRRDCTAVGGGPKAAGPSAPSNLQILVRAR